MQPRVYIPNRNGAERLRRALQTLASQSRTTDVTVIDNASSDGSAELVEREFGDFDVLRLELNLGFGRAINRAIRERPGDPVILVNNDVECEPDFLAALLEAHGDGTEMVAGVLVQERAPERIDSAGVVADRTLMGFDYLHGEPVAAAETAAAPLGPTGAAALYRLDAFAEAGGFDERIFLYYEDLDLALRIRAAGGRCRLAPAARALHAYSETLGARSAEKVALTGWSRGYMLRRYGVMSQPRSGFRALACEGVICAGQLVRDRTVQGLSGRLRGGHAAKGLEARHAPDDALLDIPVRRALQMRWRRHSD